MVRWVEPGILWGIFAEYSREYSFGALAAGSGSARLGVRSGVWLGSAGSQLGWRLGLGGLTGSNMARVDVSRHLPLGAWAARGRTVQNLQAARVGYLRLR